MKVVHNQCPVDTCSTVDNGLDSFPISAAIHALVIDTTKLLQELSLAVKRCDVIPLPGDFTAVEDGHERQKRYRATSGFVK